MIENEIRELDERVRARRLEHQLRELRELADFLGECPVCEQLYPPVPIIERLRRLPSRFYFFRENFWYRRRRTVAKMLLALATKLDRTVIWASRANKP